MRNGLAILTMGAAALLALSSVGLAAKGGNAGTQGGGSNGSSIELRVLTSQSFGGLVTFNVSTSRTDQPWVNVSCSQGADVVYTQWHGFYDSYEFGQVFTLGPTPSWTSGPAKCEARLVVWGKSSYRTLASTLFDAAG